MAFPLILAAITAAKMLGDAEKEKQSKKIRAAEIRYSPWTKMGPSTQVQYSNPWDTLSQGAGTYMAGEQADTRQAQQDLMNQKQMDLMQSQMDWYGRAGGATPILNQQSLNDQAMQLGTDEYVNSLRRGR